MSFTYTAGYIGLTLEYTPRRCQVQDFHRLSKEISLPTWAFFKRLRECCERRQQVLAGNSQDFRSLACIIGDFGSLYGKVDFRNQSIRLFEISEVHVAILQGITEKGLLTNL